SGRKDLGWKHRLHCRGIDVDAALMPFGSAVSSWGSKPTEFGTCQPAEDDVSHRWTEVTHTTALAQRGAREPSRSIWEGSIRATPAAKICTFMHVEWARESFRNVASLWACQPPMNIGRNRGKSIRCGFPYRTFPDGQRSPARRDKLALYISVSASIAS